MKKLEKSFYPDDIAAAAIMLYAGQGGRHEVRRRTLTKAPFIPLRTKESLPRAAKRLPAVQQQSRPAGHGAPRRSLPAVQPQSRPSPQGAPRRSPPAATPQKRHDNRQKVQQGQKRHGGQGTPQGNRR